MTDIDPRDRPVPPLDADLMAAIAPVGQQHGMHETAEAMLRWSTSILRVLAGPHDTAEALETLMRDCRAEHRRLGRAEEARRQRGTDHA